MNDLNDRLKSKADRISLGERIAWGSDTALMIEAAECIAELEDKNKKLWSAIEQILKRERVEVSNE
jgi:hypothetical protein